MKKHSSKRLHFLPRVFLVLLSLIVLVGCQNNTSPTAPIGDCGAFDSALCGTWSFVSQDDKGEAAFPSWFNLQLVFLYDGRFSVLGGISNYNLGDLFEKEITAPICTTKDQQLDFIEPLERFFAGDGAEFAESTSTGNSLSNYKLSCTYEVSDITKPLSKGATKEAKAAFKTYSNDLLTLHITGTWVENTVQTRSIDTTLQFERDYPVFETRYLGYWLDGEWKDSSGNAWSFTCENQDALSFSMEGKDDAKHTGKELNMYLSDSGVPQLNFRFDDGLDLMHYEIVACDRNTFTFNDGTATPFVLTRVK